MPTERKKATVAELADKLSRMQFAVVADYRGLTVAEIGNLRAKLREHHAEFVVAKNTLLRIAARQAGRESIEPLLEGPTAVAFAYDDVAKAAEALQDYLKTSKKLTVRGGLLGSSVIPADGLEDVTRMPTRDEVLGQVVGGIVSPLTGFAGLLDRPATELVGLIDAPPRDTLGVLNAAITDFSGVLQARINQLQSEEAA
jgi:large subunit ribosomal protein L10